jgi:hypothetical protein
MVDVLDVIDPEVAALSTLTNVQNSLFVPNLGSWINRMPTYTLSPPSPRDESSTETEEGETTETDTKQTRPKLAHRLSSVLDEGPERQFAVLPEEMTLEGWTKEEMEELNDRVRHMLHSRRSAFKRSMVGFGKYVSKPLGFLVTLYATLITLFGLAWVLFLIGMLSSSDITKSPTLTYKKAGSMWEEGNYTSSMSSITYLWLYSRSWVTGWPPSEPSTRTT